MEGTALCYPLPYIFLDDRCFHFFLVMAFCVPHLSLALPMSWLTYLNLGLKVLLAALDTSGALFHFPTSTGNSNFLFLRPTILPISWSSSYLVFLLKGAMGFICRMMEDIVHSSSWQENHWWRAQASEVARMSEPACCAIERGG